MAVNSSMIIQEIEQEFAQLLDYVTNDAAYQATADQMERGLFTQLLQLGQRLLQLFFVLRSQQSSRDAHTLATGESLPYHRDTKRDYRSIFGRLEIWRPYFYQRAVGSACPLDAALSLGADSYSDMLREMAEYLGVYGVYHKVTDILTRFFGVRVSSRALRAQVLADADDVVTYYAQQAPPPVTTEAEILVVQADGKGVPIIKDGEKPASVRLGKGQKHGHKKEAIVTSAYTSGAAPRTPEAVLASYYDLAAPAEAEPSPSRSAPHNKRTWATLEGKDTALTRLTTHVQARDGAHIQARVALCDGCEALQNRITTHFPEFTQILDFVHANEYLWKAANALLGEADAARTPWMVAHTRQLLTGHTQQLIDELRQCAADPETQSSARQQLTQTANYFARNRHYMDYATYLARGWPIASGVIEGACRHFVKDRCELSGMRWSLTGAEQLLSLRAVAVNDNWDQYHAFRRRERHERLYDLPFPEAPTPEVCALAA